MVCDECGSEIDTGNYEACKECGKILCLGCAKIDLNLVYSCVECIVKKSLAANPHPESEKR